MASPTYTLLADLDDDGTFESAWAAYLRRWYVSLQRGSALDSFGPRVAEFELDNEDSRFSPKNTAGPYYPNLKRRRKVQFKAKVTTPAVTNIAENPSAETDIVGFLAIGSALARDTAESWTGGASAKFTVGDADGLGGGITKRDVNRLDVTVGLSYVWAPRVKGVSGKTMKIQISWWNSAGVNFQTDEASFTFGDGWIQPSLIVTAPTGAVTAIPLIVTDGFQGVFDFWMDASWFYQGSTLLPYVDGDQAACSWSGTAHQSTSSRPANPDIVEFTGFIEDIRLRQDQKSAIMVFSCTGLTDDLEGRMINAGPFTRKPAKHVINRLLDIMTPGEIIDDGANRVYGDDITGTPPGVATGITDSAKSVGNDPEDYGAIEGDFVRYFQVADETHTGEIFELDITSRTDNTAKYDIAQFVSTDDDLLDGKAVKLKAVDDVGTVYEQSVVLDKTKWQYFRGQDIQFSGAATVRKLQWQFPAAMNVGILQDWIIDCLHMSPSKERIDRRLPSGASKFDDDLEYVDAFDRSALATLEEAVKSAGGWFYEAGDGALVFEDFNTRSSTGTPKLRLSDSSDRDGYRVTVAAYREPPANFYNRIRVGSYGDVTLLTNDARTGWAFEPLPRAYAANARILLHSQHMGEAEMAEGGIILRRAVVKSALGAGAFQDDTRNGRTITSPYIENYGRNGLIIFKTDAASGLTLDKLLVKGLAQTRTTSERTFVEHVVSGSESDPERVLTLETPAQGYKTQLMTDLAAWAARYGAGISVVDVRLPPAQDEAELLETLGRSAGLPVHLRLENGPGALMVNELYYVEGWEIRDDLAHNAPQLRLLLEEAA